MLAGIVATIAGILVGATVAVWWINRDSAADPVNPEQTGKPVSVIITGDTAGWIVPCGCASNQSGGLLRLGSFVGEVSKEREVVLLDAGGSPGGVSPYDLEKFLAIVKGKLKLGLAAHNLGEPELKFGLEQLRSVQSQLKAPFISANLRDAGGVQLFEGSRLIEAGRQRLLVVGVVSPQFATEAFQISAPSDAVLAAADQHKDRYDTLLVLAYLPETELRQLAKELPEADIVAGGPTGQSIAPEHVGRQLVTSATNKGKFAVHLRPPAGSAKRWTGEVVELDESFSDDSEQVENLEAFYAVLEEKDFKASETDFLPPQPVNPPERFRIAGSETCGDCHEADRHVWEMSAHAHAWETLIKERSHVDSDCQRCHTTGFGLPGGFVSAKRSLHRVNVGCESCHGPSQGHVENPDVKTAFAARDSCLHCHDPENSPQFDYETYWEQIRHGGDVTETEKTP